MSESKMTGPWKETAAALKAANEAIRDGIKKATAKNLFLLEAALVRHLQNQDLKWRGLNPIYKKWKEKKKLSNQILIATSTLMNSITRQLINGGLEGFVGVLRNAPSSARKGGNKNKRPKPVLIAAVHEYGIGNPARPLFQPTLKENEQAIKDNYAASITRALKDLMPNG